jgi:hypothetical protein
MDKHYIKSKTITGKHCRKSTLMQKIKETNDIIIIIIIIIIITIILLTQI